MLTGEGGSRRKSLESAALISSGLNACIAVEQSSNDGWQWQCCQRRSLSNFCLSQFTVVVKLSGGTRYTGERVRLLTNSAFQ